MKKHILINTIISLSLFIFSSCEKDKIVELKDLPVADFSTQSTSISQGNNIQFTDISTNNPTSWLWDFGDGETSREQNPLHTYLDDGIFSISLVVSNSGGSDKKVRVGYIVVSSASPVSNFSSNLTVIAQGKSISFVDQSTNNPISWSWNFGDGNISNEQNPTHTFSKSGVYTINLTTSNKYGSNVVTKQDYITVNTLAPLIDFIANIFTISQNEKIKFTDLSANSPTEWLWNFGDGKTSTLQNPTHTYTEKGVYGVNLVATNKYGNTTLSKTDYITVNGPKQYISDFSDLSNYQNWSLVSEGWINSDIKDYGTAFMKFTAKYSGTLSFSYVTSSEEDYDFLVLYVNDVYIFSKSGLMLFWEEFSGTVQQGDVISIGYYKDRQTSKYDDAVIVKNIEIESL